MPCACWSNRRGGSTRVLTSAWTWLSASTAFRYPSEVLEPDTERFQEALEAADMIYRFVLLARLDIPRRARPYANTLLTILMITRVSIPSNRVVGFNQYECDMNEAYKNVSIPSDRVVGFNCPDFFPRPFMALYPLPRRSGSVHRSSPPLLQEKPGKLQGNQRAPISTRDYTPFPAVCQVHARATAGRGS